MTNEEKIKSNLKKIVLNLLQLFLSAMPIVLIIHLVTGASIVSSGKAFMWIFVMWIGEGFAKEFDKALRKESASKKNGQQ